MQIVIDISKETYEYWKNHSYEYVLAEAIKNGIPLPEGHWLNDANSDRQRYVIRGINNDKIEFVDKYSVRAFNRYVKFIKYDKNVVLDEIKAEIKEWYWQADRQILAKDPCVVDAMVDLFIRTIDKYKTKSEERDE